MADPNVERIKAFIETHRQTYDQQALRQRLIDDGHDPHAVDLALAQVLGLKVDAETVPQPSSSTTPMILIALGTSFTNYIVMIGLIFALTTLLSTFEVYDSLVTVVIAVFLLLLASNVVAFLRFRRNNRVWSRGIFWGMMITFIPLIALTLTLGLCIAYISGLSFQ